MSNVETVKAVYEAFGRGDVPFILSRINDTVAWEKWDDNYAQKAGVPYMREKQTREEVVEFFQEVAKLGITRFEVVAIMDGGDKVAAEIELQARDFDEQEIHLWTFNDEGRITGFRHYFDTAKHIAVAENDRNSAAA